MKKIVLATACCLALGACSESEASSHDQGKGKPVIGMPNPASAYCVRMGGTLEIRKEPDGSRGYCHLPDGRVVEEWAFFRSSAPHS